MLKRIKPRRIGWLPAVSGIVVFLLVDIMVIEAISHRTRNRVDVSEGLALIEAAQNADVTAIELKIQSLDAQDELGGGRSLKEIFASSVIMGDSMAQGFSEYDILNASSVVADIGVSLTDLDDQIGRVREINPQYIFMTYGANDVLTTNGDVEIFIEQYRNALREVQAQLPNTRVLVNSIFPVRGRRWKSTRSTGRWTNITRHCGNCATGCRLPSWIIRRLPGIRITRRTACT